MILIRVTEEELIYTISAMKDRLKKMGVFPDKIRAKYAGNNGADAIDARIERLTEYREYLQALLDEHKKDEL